MYLCFENVQKKNQFGFHFEASDGREEEKKQFPSYFHFSNKRRVLCQQKKNRPLRLCAIPAQGRVSPHDCQRRTNNRCNGASRVGKAQKNRRMCLRLECPFLGSVVSQPCFQKQVPFRRQENSRYQKHGSIMPYPGRALLAQIPMRPMCQQLQNRGLVPVF